MITIVSLNPSLDRTVTVRGFCPGTLNRALHSRLDVGGKGMNAAGVLIRMRVPVRMIGWMPRHGSEEFYHKLDAAGVAHDFLQQPGAVRVNTKIVGETDGSLTEINEPGVAVSAEDIRKLTEMVRTYAGQSTWMLFSGSLPPGCADGLYAALVAAAREANCCVALDVDGARLKNALPAHPDLIKPNARELGEIMGREIGTAQDAACAAAELVADGVGTAVVSLGAAGAVCVTRDGSWKTPALKVAVRSVVGAGDAMLAGMLSVLDGAAEEIPRALQVGTACAAATVMTEGTQGFSGQTLVNLLPQVCVCRLDA